MAVILGAVSGGLTCRDFDEMGAYENWASKHPDLAQTLPTVKTSRGRHVYFKSELDRIKKFDDGELKGGGYCLLPPSVHPNGTGYEWLIPINGNLITIEPEEAGFLTQHTQHTKQAQHTQQTHTIKIGVNKKKVQEIIKDTLPVKYGQRNQRIFYLALYIRSMDGNWDKKPTGFRWAVQEWHRQALPNIKTKEFEGTWLDFMVAWNNLVHGVIDPLQILEFCRTLEPPSKIVKDWPKRPELHLLCLWCRELHKAHAVYDSMAFLGCRKIGKGLKISHETGNQYFRILDLEDYVEVIEIGAITEKGALSTTFKYIFEDL